MFVGWNGLQLLKTLETVSFSSLLLPEELQMDATVIAH